MEAEKESTPPADAVEEVAHIYLTFMLIYAAKTAQICHPPFELTPKLNSRRR